MPEIHSKNSDYNSCRMLAKYIGIFICNVLRLALHQTDSSFMFYYLSSLYAMAVSFPVSQVVDKQILSLLLSKSAVSKIMHEKNFPF